MTTASRGDRAGRPAGPAWLRVNPIACSGHGLCAELLPELISLDEWGYPLALRLDPAQKERRGSA
jgi:hypothetical protein